MTTGAKRIAWLVLMCVFSNACRDRSHETAKTEPQSGADRVLVVVNTQSAASDTVGRYYVEQRKIAPSHVVRIDAPTTDEIGELEYRNKILAPIRAAIDSLPVRIDFIVLMTGVPLRIGGNRGYSVDAFIAGSRLLFPPMVGFDTAWLKEHRNPYYASTERFNSDRYSMYLVTRIDCDQTVDCLALIDNSIAAKPAYGPLLFDAADQTMTDPGYSAMNSMLKNAGQRLRAAGANVIVDSSARFVRSSQSLMGYVSWGSNDSHFDSAAYHSIRFLPGALAETYVSTSGRTFKPTTGGQSRIVDLVHQGVTGVKGYVSEPYTVALVQPGILFDRYFHGFTLAESFYAASWLVLWKDIVIGDPLCAPFAQPTTTEPGTARADSTGS
ncbi:MAG: TIGR03790 family protein [Gemmatimonadaceae bacterium]